MLLKYLFFSGSFEDTKPVSIIGIEKEKKENERKEQPPSYKGSLFNLILLMDIMNCETYIPSSVKGISVAF